MNRIAVCIGIGCQRGTTLATLLTALDAALSGLGAVEIRCIASHARKADEPGLRALLSERGYPLLFYPAEQLAAVTVPNPSAQVADVTGSPSVAEAAALLAAGSRELLVDKRRFVGSDGRSVTIAVARCQPGASEPCHQDATMPTN